MATSDSLIQVKNLKKHYHRGAIKALDGVTANINKGDVMAVSYTHLLHPECFRLQDQAG